MVEKPFTQPIGYETAKDCIAIYAYGSFSLGFSCERINNVGQHTLSRGFKPFFARDGPSCRFQKFNGHGTTRQSCVRESESNMTNWSPSPAVDGSVLCL